MCARTEPADASSCRASQWSSARWARTSWTRSSRCALHWPAACCCGRGASQLTRPAAEQGVEPRHRHLRHQGASRRPAQAQHRRSQQGRPGWLITRWQQHSSSTAEAEQQGAHLRSVWRTRCASRAPSQRCSRHQCCCCSPQRAARAAADAPSGRRLPTAGCPCWASWLASPLRSLQVCLRPDAGAPHLLQDNGGTPPQWARQPAALHARGVLCRHQPAAAVGAGVVPHRAPPSSPVPLA